MRTRKLLSLLVLGLLLTGTIGAENALVATHRTVLDPGFVKQSLAEEGGYDVLSTAAIETLGGPAAGELNNSEMGVLASLTAEAYSEALLDPAYLEGQTNANIDETYAYLHGDAAEPRLAIDLAPAQASFAENLESSIVETPTADLVGDLDFADTAFPLDTALLRDAETSEAGFLAARAELRETVREQVIQQAVGQAFETATDDQLLALVIANYDSDDYTATEKAREVETRRSAIEAALRERIEADDERVEALTDEALAELETQAVAAVEAAVPPEELDPALVAATTDLTAVVVTGLTDEDVTYNAFTAALVDAKATLAQAIATEMNEQLAAELGGTELVLTEELPAESKQAFENARTVVTVLDRGVVVLAGISLVLVGLTWFADRSGVTLLSTVGGAFVLAGGISFALGSVASTQLGAAIASSDGPIPAFADLVLALIGRVTSVFTGQSLVLVGLGLGCILGAVVLHYHVDSIDHLNAAT
ncbi:hypothetical protein [Haladaptatus sp. DJG-WS-42]|uniref:hypothetical protein n=1 Tax=Haladaptatus sp. DJG-WS-42 TaxID=3120516 RepID=UPI0030CF1098